MYLSIGATRKSLKGDPGFNATTQKTCEYDPSQDSKKIVFETALKEFISGGDMSNYTDL